MVYNQHVVSLSKRTIRHQKNNTIFNSFFKIRVDKVMNLLEKWTSIDPWVIFFSPDDNDSKRELQMPPKPPHQ